MKLKKELIDVIKDNGFTCSSIEQQGDKDFYVELSQTTPAGEDWHWTVWFDGTDDNFISALEDDIYYFDVDEQVEPFIDNRGKYGIPGSIKLLVEDAEWKLKQLEKLFDAINNI